RCEEVANKLCLSMVEVALEWVMAKSTAPIVSTTSSVNLQGLIDAVNAKLGDEYIKALEEQYLPRSVFGHA
ncbi:hypothetical protein PENSPDRAFT_576702, partial [Peniophora sp. CONT]